MALNFRSKWKPNGSRFRWELNFSTQVYSPWFRCEGIRGGSDDSRQLQLSLAIFGQSLYLTWSGVLPNVLQVPKDGQYNFDESHGRVTGAYLSHNHLVVSWNQTRMSWGRDTKKYGHSWSWFVDEVIFGKRKYEQVQPVQHKWEPLQLPEACYHLDITLSQDTWRYARWPWWPLTKVVPRAHITVIEPKGIIKPGKGENSWDCGDDSTHELTTPAATVEEAKQAMLDCVYQDRKRYGSGPNMYVGKEPSNGTREPALQL